MPEYFHSALRGEQIHEAKIKVLPANSSFPVPEWEGQMLVVGLKFYVSIQKNNTLIWIQPKASNTPSLPANTVIFEEGYGSPQERSSNLSGVIYTNLGNNDNYYLSKGTWLKLGAGSSSNDNLLIIPSNSYEYSQPPSGQMNAALLKKWEPNKKYYFRFEGPNPGSLEPNALNRYFIHLRYSNKVLGADISPLGASILLDTVELEIVDDRYLIMVYFEKMIDDFYRAFVYCNFEFDLESRLIKVTSIAQNYYN